MNVKRCELVSRLSDDSGNPLFDIENMKLILASKNCIRDYSYIIHDKDTYTAEDEKTNASHISGSLKPEHIHLLLRFDNNKPQNTKFVCKWFKISENFIGKITGKWQDALLYLTHRNAPDKYQYSEDDVVANFNYKEVIDEYEEKANPLEEAIDGILNGRIREYNKTLEIDHKLLVFYSQKINEAFKVRQEWLQATGQKQSRHLFNGQRMIQFLRVNIVVFNGIGKTQYFDMFQTFHGMDKLILHIRRQRRRNAVRINNIGV